jgi:proline iminopeptidase
MDGERFITVNEVRHWTRWVGPARGRPLVVLHGGPGGTVYDFERIAGVRLEALTARPVLYYEQRGSGRSDPPGGGAYSLPLLVDDLEQLRREFGIARMALLGT